MDIKEKEARIRKDEEKKENKGTKRHHVPTTNILCREEGLLYHVPRTGVHMLAGGESRCVNELTRHVS